MSLLANSNAIESGGYPIQRSLRFRSSASAYLSRTPAVAGNRKTWTWSGWVKRSALGATQWLFDADNGSTDSTEFNFAFTSSDTLSVSGSLTTWRITTQVFRDAGAWYHIVCAIDTTQATANNRIRLYVNGSEITAFGTLNNPTQNLDLAVNQAIAHYIGIRTGLTSPLSAYLAEVNFIDGQALTPSSFGYTEPLTGVWQPLKYMGTYGTNGFYLPFSDNTSATTLAYDKSGNGNNWTANNISTTAGATYDSMTDVPTLTSATAANYCVLNPLDQNASTITSGNLNAVIATNSSPNGMYVSATIGATSGKYYWETTYSSGSSELAIGVIDANSTFNTTLFISGVGYFALNGNKYINGSSTSYGSTYTTNDVIGVALDLDAGTVTFYKNNTSQGAITLPTGVSAWKPSFANGTRSASQTFVANFGQRPFSYTPPTGFVALNTFNLPDPTIKKPNQYMDATLYTGTGATQSITNAAGFQPDFVWVKGRSGATDHALYDAVRGVQKQLESNTTTAETTETTGLTAFNSNGFSVGALAQMNTNAATYVGWQWKESATAGFDIVTYTGNGANRTISHSLGVAPSMMIVKSRSQGTTGYTGNWAVWHSAIANTEYLLLNTTATKATGATYWNSTTPTSSVFSLGTAAVVNNNNDNFVNYLFAEIAGFSKFGSYTGNGSADGPFVYCGFRPKYVMVKRTDVAADWYVRDSSRDPFNLVSKRLWASLSDAEDTNAPTDSCDFISNGFKARGAGSLQNASGGTYIYMAFAETPFRFALAR